MPVVNAEMKFYLPDGNGDIDLNNEYTNFENYFPDSADQDADVEKPVFIKNTNATDTAQDVNLYIVNAPTLLNTSGTPLVTNSYKILDHIPVDGGLGTATYTLSMATATSVIVTPPSGVSLPAQDIIKDGSTLVKVLLSGQLGVSLVFDASTAQGNTATIKISNGGSFMTMAPDVAGSPGTFIEARSMASPLALGDMAGNGAVRFHMKQSIPDDTSNVGNPRKFAIVKRFKAA